MPLRDRPEFQAWLESFEARHASLHGDEPRLVSCDGCGEPLTDAGSTTGLCSVCLAEAYGYERGQAAGRIAGIMEAALAYADGAQVSDVREAIEEVLDRYERSERGATG